MRNYLIIALVVAIGAALYFVYGTDDASPQMTDAIGAPIVEIAMPTQLSSNAQLGQTIFTDKCAACHGENAVGQQGVAPPLIHIIYEPSHHGDESFQRAVAIGVPQHHWSFGNMPPVEGLTRADVAMVVDYIRTIQRANGIN